jgi:hypothetical protein
VRCMRIGAVVAELDELEQRGDPRAAGLDTSRSRQ